MKIQIEKLELSRTTRIKSLNLREVLCADYSWIKEIYIDDARPHFFVVTQYIDSACVKTRTHLIPAQSAVSAILAEEAVPKHQTVGTPENRDTLDGRKKRGSEKKAKSELAKRIEARKASTPNIE